MSMAFSQPVGVSQEGWGIPSFAWVSSARSLSFFLCPTQVRQDQDPIGELLTVSPLSQDIQQPLSLWSVLRHRYFRSFTFGRLRRHVDNGIKLMYGLDTEGRTGFHLTRLTRNTSAQPHSHALSLRNSKIPPNTRSRCETLQPCCCQQTLTNSGRYEPCAAWSYSFTSTLGISSFTGFVLASYGIPTSSVP